MRAFFRKLAREREAADLRRLRATVSVGDWVVINNMGAPLKGMVVNVRAYANGETEFQMDEWSDWLPVSRIIRRAER